MKQQNIASLYNIKNRFLRSINLQRDFNDTSSLSSYVLTDHALECLNRISEGTKKHSSQRAWRITGDYGSGKSNFALFLAHWLYDDEKELPSQIKKQLNAEGISKNDNKYFPLLLTGAREPMGLAILKTLMLALSELSQASSLQEKIERAINKTAVNDSDVINYLLEANKHINSLGYDGLILIIDELGKFLEYAALYPEEQDIYLMQELAETASGSNNNTMFIVGILHQGFSAYADTLSQTSQHEWEKVAGRYDEILFNQPLEQLAYLINSALGLKSNELSTKTIDLYKKWMEFFISKGWYGNSVGIKSLSDISTKIYPLHPGVFPVVVDAFRRFGQNERSLFSFLLSNDPHGLQDFSLSEDISKIYRLHNLYDYIKINFGHKLHAQSYRSYWHVIDSLIDSFLGESELEIQILKTIGIINLLDNNRFIASKETITCALDGISVYSKSIIEEALDKLSRVQRVIYHRGRSGGYCLWPHTSVNLEAAYQKAQDEVGKIKRASEYIKSSLVPRPIVARRHYIQTGNLRTFNLKYCLTDEFNSVIKKLDGSVDGYIVIPLCETTEEHKKCTRIAKQITNKENLLIAVPKPLNALSSLIKEVRSWQYVEQNTFELNSDSYACEEVKRQQKNALNNLEHRLENFVNVKHFTLKKSLQWFRKGELQKIQNGRDLLSKLSDYSDAIYNKSPQIKNELVNRKKISSAAAGARMRLITGILENPNEYRLGLEPEKTPPEIAIYLSLISNGGLHKKNGDKWEFNLPSKENDACNLLPSFKKIEELLKKNSDSKVTVSDIYSALKEFPYGVRDGVIPIILAVYYSIHENDIAVYDEGSFLKKIRQQEFLRLSKAPENFEFQYCSIEGVRAELFNKMLDILKISNKRQQPNLLDVVKPLCIFVAGLSDYVRKTKRLSDRTILIRDAILNAKEPITLLFNDLPLACGLAPISPGNAQNKNNEDFIQILKESLDELKFCYHSLRDRIKESLTANFEYKNDFNEFRISIAERAQVVLLSVIEPQIKAFSFRLFDDSLAEGEWLESVGAFVTSKTPERWTDVDEDKFFHELPILVQRFKNIESIAFDDNKNSKTKSNGCKISMTKSTGEELNQVLYYTEEELKSLGQLQKQMATLIAKNPKLGVIAASQEIWKRLS